MKKVSRSLFAPGGPVLAIWATLGALVGTAITVPASEPVASASLSAGAPAKAPVGTKSKPAVEDCGFAPAELKPKELTLACADAGAIGSDLVWHSWGASQAYATGTYTWHICEPSCVASRRWAKARANFTLQQPTDTSAGWLFEKLVVNITGHVPPQMEKHQVYIFRPLK
ncbi:MAG TPA: hypothetical protein VME20_02655 [Acidimicrobiales bacterium]|nr:hypothetical protein [Acidimicrobiales bacterium]